MLFDIAFFSHALPSTQLSFIETVYSSTLMLFAVVEFHLKFSIIIIVIAHASLRSHEKTFYLRLLQIVIRWCFFFLESNMLLILLTTFFLFHQILFLFYGWWWNYFHRYKYYSVCLNLISYFYINNEKVLKNYDYGFYYCLTFNYFGIVLIKLHHY